MAKKRIRVVKAKIDVTEELRKAVLEDAGQPHPDIESENFTLETWAQQALEEAAEKISAGALRARLQKEVERGISAAEVLQKMAGAATHAEPLLDEAKTLSKLREIVMAADPGLHAELDTPDKLPVDYDKEDARHE